MNVMISTCESFRADAEARLSPQWPASILFTDEAGFCDWIAHAAAGASTVYFRGHLAYDRMPSSNTFHEPERKRLVAVARRAMQAAEDGLVHLVQRRHGPGDYSYLAIKALVGRPGRLIGQPVWRALPERIASARLSCAAVAIASVARPLRARMRPAGRRWPGVQQGLQEDAPWAATRSAGQ